MSLRMIKKFLDEPFVMVPKGNFVMGSEQGLPIEMPRHCVNIEKDFFFGVHPVTQRLWQKINGSNPSHFKSGDFLPVENVDWHDACRFCISLSSLIGKKVRLPTEAEWEYACRAGSTTEYFWGDESKNAPAHAWFELNSLDSTHPVGTKKPNQWGVHDMAGNVWEWCADLWRADYTTDALELRRPSIEMERRVIRGGAWDMDVFRCRSAYRSCEGESVSSKKIGFRVVIEIDRSP